MTFSFQIRVGVNGVEDIRYAYGPLQGNGDLGFLTVGAENPFGKRGDNYYVDGTSTLPVKGAELVVSTTKKTGNEILLRLHLRPHYACSLIDTRGAGDGEYRVKSFSDRGILCGIWFNR